ncbi:AidA/PixA family protein [Burkholderia contaminans]|uniref:Inclusion body protein n=1 Tax=Burkholderia contaminans TaxID=488447 RepID=A0A6P2V2Q5_9BURK|nr:AidA/PixA family protein [Burkholderia contaminans]VWC75393.1 inclusion body protein [Burkholderia contaminans]
MSGLRCDALVIVDAVTLLSAYPEASRDPAAPTVIDGRHLYVVSPGDAAPLGHNDSRLFTGLSPGDQLRLRETALALRAEVSVLFVRFTLKDAGIVAPIEPEVRDAATPVPDADDLLHPPCHPMKDHYWRSDVLAAGATTCTADFGVYDRDGTVSGYFRWETSIEIAGSQADTKQPGFKPSSDRNGHFTLPPNTAFKAIFYANAADRQDLKLFIDDAPEPAASFVGNSEDGVRMFTLNSNGGKIRIDASANGRPSATDARLAPLSAGDSVWLGWLGAEDGADADYNDGIVILQWPIT